MLTKYFSFAEYHKVIKSTVYKTKLNSNVTARIKSHEHQAAKGHVLLAKQGYPKIMFQDACANRCVGEMKDHRILRRAGRHVRASDTRKA